MTTSSPDTADPAASPQIFDRALVARRQARAQREGGEHFLRERVATDMVERIGDITRDFPNALELGGAGAFAQALMRGPAAVRDKVGWLTRCDLSAARASPGGVAADEERLPFRTHSFDLIVAPLGLHTVNDLPGALIQIHRALKPNGLFLGALIGGESLTELRQALLAGEMATTGGAGLRIAPMADALDLAALLQRAGFALPVSDTDRVTVRYGEPFGLLKDLRAMGETAAMAARARRPLTRGTLLAAMADYQARFADEDGRVRATFDVVWATGWAPHESQQQPLKPGSAEVRLADALGVTEHSAGEKAGR